MERDAAHSGVSLNPVEDLYRRAGAAQYEIALDEFAAILRGIATQYGTAGPSHDRAGSQPLTDLEVAAFWLKRERFLPDLALARGCARGSNAAWVSFIARFRPQLYHVALGLTREETSARDLADSVYADLYGLPRSDGKRTSKLDYYAGLGSLEGWLKVVLAQEYTNRYRRSKREVSLEQEDEDGKPLKDRLAADNRASEPGPPADPRLVESVDEAFTVLQAREKLILSLYFLEGWNLAQIGRLLGVHESTISRRVEQITSHLRDLIRAGLRRRGMSPREAREALETDVRDMPLDIAGRLRETQGKGG